jgi:hypothetical protein
MDFSAYLLSASPPGFELTAARVLSCLPSSAAGGSPRPRPAEDIDDTAGRSWTSGWRSTSSPWSSCGQQCFAAAVRPSILIDRGDDDEYDDDSDDVDSSSSGNGSESPTSSSSRSALLSSPRQRKSSNGSTGSGGGLTKKVSFADDIGQILEQIRVFTESSDTPPNLSPRVIRRHGSVDCFSSSSSSSSEFGSPRRRLSPPTSPRSSFFGGSSSCPTDLASLGGSGSGGTCCSSASPSQQRLASSPSYVRLVPNFAMPVADRTAYLDRLDHQCVCLESVGTSIDPPTVAAAVGGVRCARCGSPDSAAAVVAQRLIGSVGVKNLAFDKSVFVRCSFNGWRSFVDVRAVYARSERGGNGVTSSNGQSSAAARNFVNFDVFEFSINLPTEQQLQQLQQRVTGSDAASPRSRMKVELAVYYDAAGCRYWDNNNGSNYELLELPSTSSTSAPCLVSASLVDEQDTAVAADKNTTDAVVFASSRRQSGHCWTEFSGWNAVNQDCPYW